MRPDSRGPVRYAPLTRLFAAARRRAIRRAPVASIRQRAKSTLTPNWSATSSFVAFRRASSLAASNGTRSSSAISAASSTCGTPAPASLASRVWFPTHVRTLSIATRLSRALPANTSYGVRSPLRTGCHSAATSGTRSARTVLVAVSYASRAPSNARGRQTERVIQRARISLLAAARPRSLHHGRFAATPA
jgi:hypothetical protein